MATLHCIKTIVEKVKQVNPNAFYGEWIGGALVAVLLLVPTNVSPALSLLPPPSLPPLDHHQLSVMDPVMGDDGKLYVPTEVIPAYQKDMLALADVITPNQFEAE